MKIEHSVLRNYREKSFKFDLNGDPQILRQIVDSELLLWCHNIINYIKFRKLRKYYLFNLPFVCSCNTERVSHHMRLKPECDTAPNHTISSVLCKNKQGVTNSSLGRQECYLINWKHTYYFVHKLNLNWQKMMKKQSGNTGTCKSNK